MIESPKLVPHSDVSYINNGTKLPNDHDTTSVTSKVSNDNASIGTSRSAAISLQAKKQRSNKDRIKSRLERRRRRDRAVNIQVYSVSSGDDMSVLSSNMNSTTTNRNSNSPTKKEQDSDTSTVITAATAAMTEVSACMNSTSSNTAATPRDVFSMAVEFLLPSPVVSATPPADDVASNVINSMEDNDDNKAITGLSSTPAVTPIDPISVVNKQVGNVNNSNDTVSDAKDITGKSKILDPKKKNEGKNVDNNDMEAKIANTTENGSFFNVVAADENEEPSSFEDFLSPMARMRLNSKGKNSKKSESPSSGGKGDYNKNNKSTPNNNFHNEDASVGSNSTEKTRNSPTKRRNSNKKKSLPQSQLSKQQQVNSNTNTTNNTNLPNNTPVGSSSYLNECTGTDSLSQMGGLPDILRKMFSGDINLNSATCGSIAMGNGHDDNVFLDEDDEDSFFSEDSENSLYSDEEDDSAYYDTENDDHTHASTISEGSESSQSTFNTINSNRSKKKQHSLSAGPATGETDGNSVSSKRGRATTPVPMQPPPSTEQQSPKNSNIPPPPPSQSSSIQPSSSSKSANTNSKSKSKNENQSRLLNAVNGSSPTLLKDKGQDDEDIKEEKEHLSEPTEKVSKKKKDKNDDSSKKKKDGIKAANPFEDPQFVERFIEEMIQEGVLLTWHKAQAAQYYERPKQVTASLELGKVENGTFAEPKLSWQVDADGSSSVVSGSATSMVSSSSNRENVHQVDLFDIVSVKKAGAMNFHSYPFAIPSNSFFVELSNGTSILMEAKDPLEQQRIISGLSQMMSRLSYNLIAGDIDVCWDLFACSDCMDADNISPENLTVEELDLWFISKAMNDVTHRLVEKSSNQVTATDTDDEEEV